MTQSNDMTKAEIRIDGMTCAMCAGAIEKALRQLPGVGSVMSPVTVATLSMPLKKYSPPVKRETGATAS